MPISVLLTEAYHPLLLERLRREPRVIAHHLERPTEAELAAALSETHIWVMRGAFPVNEERLQAAPKLQVIIRAGSGIEHIDKAALRGRGIRLYSTPQANAIPVAEYVLAAVLMLSRRFLSAHHALRQEGTWMRHQSIGRELASLKVGIIGFGQNGSRTAHLLAATGAQVLAYDKYKAGFGGLGVQEVTLEELFEQVDVLSLHVPLTAETANWVNADFLRRFRQPIALINPARGGIVHLPSVVQALKEGRLWGAAIDTFPVEPPEKLSSEDAQALAFLRAHPSVLLTPHIAGLTEESERRLAEAVLLLLKLYLESVPDTQ